MKKVMIITAIISVFVMTVCVCLYMVTDSNALLAISITFGTTAYHVVMRLIVGLAVNQIMHNKADYKKRWYQSSEFEKQLYDRLNVKHWKGKMPAYDPDLFDCKKHSWEEMIQATCQAEIVHEIIVILSFVPICFSVWFGEVMVFVITSILAAAFDMMFVIVQRYNRPRMIYLIIIE